MLVSARCLLLSLLMASAISAQGKNLLFYGNSFTYYSWGFGVPEMVGLIASEAGHATPNIVQALIGGATLGDHATDPAQVAIISNALPAGETWDHVIMQGRTQEATDYGGFNRLAFRNNAVAITGNVRSHSPLASAIMYQTWAVAWGHMYYPLPWAVPLEMHEDVRLGYRLAVSDILATFGSGTAWNAAVGDAVALLEFDPAWYEPDLGHPSPSIILLAAMGLYTTMYGTTVCEIDPDFTPGSALSQALSPFGLGAAEWDFLAGISDRSADETVRRYPGSSDQLMLETATGSGDLTSCPAKQLTVGTQVQIRLRSMNGVYDNAAGILMVDFFVTGSPPVLGGPFREIQVDLGGAILGPMVFLSSALTVSFPMPITLPGGSFRVQGLAWQASLESGNALLTTTDAHELIMF
tara:strand:- start:75345 stop:76574 length:1230 start_codon:yes stop_codon:yes gene_type:complete